MPLALNLIQSLRRLALSGGQSGGIVVPGGFVLLLGADGAPLTGVDGAPLYGVA